MPCYRDVSILLGIAIYQQPLKYGKGQKIRDLFEFMKVLGIFSYGLGQIFLLLGLFFCNSIEELFVVL